MAGHESSDDKQSGNNALQYITHYTALRPFVTQQTVFIMSTQMIQRHQISCQRGLSEETIEPILGSLWRILTYNAKETSAKASKKDKSQARQCHSDPGRECLQCVGYTYTSKCLDTTEVPGVAAVPMRPRVLMFAAAVTNVRCHVPRHNYMPRYSHK